MDPNKSPSDRLLPPEIGRLAQKYREQAEPQPPVWRGQEKTHFLAVFGLADQESPLEAMLHEIAWSERHKHGAR